MAHLNKLLFIYYEYIIYLGFLISFMNEKMWLFFTVELGRNCIVSVFSSKAFNGYSLWLRS